MSASLQQAPRDEAMWLRRGLRAAQAGDRAQAQRCFESAHDSNPASLAAMLWLAWLAPSREQSLGFISRVLEQDPHHEQARAAIRWARRRPLAADIARPASLDSAGGKRSPGRNSSLHSIRAVRQRLARRLWPVKKSGLPPS